MANTPAQNQAAITAAIQAAATADLALLNTFQTTYGPNFITIENALQTVVNNMSSLARQQQVYLIQQSLVAAQATFTQLVSDTTKAQTATAVA